MNLNIKNCSFGLTNISLNTHAPSSITSLLLIVSKNYESYVFFRFT